MKRRFLASVLAAVMILSMFAVVLVSAASTKTLISAGDVTVTHGATEAEVVVSVSNVPASGLASTRFAVKVEGASITDGVEAASLRNDNPEGSDFKGSVVIGPTDKSAENGVNFMTIDMSGSLNDDTDLVVFKVKLPADAACGTEFPVKIILSDDPEDFNTVVNGKPSNVDVEAQDGKIVIGHAALTHHDAVEATAAADGVKEHWTCDACGKYFADAEGKNEVTLDSLKVAFVPGSDTDVPGSEGVTVTGGSSNASSVAVGEKVTIVADEAPEGKVFDKWEVVEGDVVLDDVNSATTTFTKIEGAVVIRAIFKPSDTEEPGDDVVPGDFTGDGKVNAKDVVGLMKAIIKGDADKNPAADFNKDGKVNAKDVIALMKAIIAGK